MRVQKKVEFERSTRGPTPGEWVTFIEVEVSGTVEETDRDQYAVALDAHLDLRASEIDRAEDALIEEFERLNALEVECGCCHGVGFYEDMFKEERRCGACSGDGAIPYVVLEEVAR